ncbi:MAG TPA: DNA-directed RNA polymerase subunit alpha [Phycisphaerae bacterium]|nr:DNA-directed RNA polymerase subunit alpha [Phycisphaerae bacterium]HPS53372.1 DNA-directed RNA polymerase subunit alpha [Phycisphaerae bacterium]
MRIRWRGLELPTRVVLDQEVSTPTYGKFAIEPFERGFGITVGNSLRRVLLSSLEGAAVTRVKIKGATHEFTTLPGVLEDIADIILNIKTLVIKSYTSEPKTMTLKSSKKGAVTAGMIECDSSIEIINKDLVIATLTDDVEFDIEFTIETSRGYVPAEELAAGEQELGVIEVDAFFSPVTRVRYRTEDTRVGQKTNYDKLIMEIWTNGTITPEMALVESGKILRKHLNPFVQYFEMGQQIPEGGMIETGNEVDEELNRKLGMSVQELELSVRASNCLESAQIETVGQLVKMAESELLKIRSFGKTSLREIKRKLADLGLSLGMNVELPQPEATVAAEGE